MADETDVKAEDKPPIPPWAWIFAVACIAIPIVSMGGAIPGGIGGGGAAACVGVARDSTKPIANRVLFCVGITAVCWTLFVLLIAGTTGLFG